MKKRYLEKNDLIRLTPGMVVNYANFEHVFYGAGNSQGASTAHVCIDRVYEARGDAWPIRIRIRNGIYDLFRQEGKKVDEDILARFLKHQVKDSVERKFVIPAGLYLVTDVHSDTLKRTVFCRTYQSDNNSPVIELHFYQGYHGAGQLNHDDIEPTQKQ